VSATLRYHAVLPAAGVGRRMAGALLPKQYLPLLGRCVLEWSVSAFLADTACESVMIAIAPDDKHFATLALASQPKVSVCVGGASRRDSVYNALTALAERAVAPDSWVMVHDAARPGLDRHLLARLQARLTEPGVDGVLLAMPLTDTLKQVDANSLVRHTLDRSQYLAAQTPQVFRLQALMTGLRQTPMVTDEASAMEQLGAKVAWVEGSMRNLKLTTPWDLQWLESVLQVEQHE
jgi:2-C-methyl-D-erythritol 4-phosphate cytidylyltransferase